MKKQELLEYVEQEFTTPREEKPIEEGKSLKKDPPTEKYMGQLKDLSDVLDTWQKAKGTSFNSEAKGLVDKIDGAIVDLYEDVDTLMDLIDENEAFDMRDE